MSQTTATIPPEQVERDATLSPHLTNLLAVPLMLGAVGLLVGLFGLRWGVAPLLRALEFEPLPAVAILVAGVLVHEGLHAVGWKLFAGVPWPAIRLGFQWQALMPYAHCRVPVPAAAYRWGAALPGLLTGALPAALGLALGNAGLLLWGAIFLAAAMGDALVLWAIRDVPGRSLVIDHPTRPGCLVVRPNALAGP